MDGGCRTGQVIDLVHLDVEREGDIVPHDFKMRIAEEMRDVVLCAGKKIVDAQHIVTRRQETLAKMRSEKPGSAGHEHACSQTISAHVQATDFRNSELMLSLESGHWGWGISDTIRNT